MNHTEYAPINSYGMIGDLHTIALIRPNGSIDWCCLPIFDSPSTFASILDKNKGGCCQVHLDGDNTSQLAYLMDTNILTNTITNEDGIIELLDYMPIENPDGTRKQDKTGYICRHIECKKGIHLKVNITFDPRPNYGENVTIHTTENSATIEEYPVSLHSTHPIQWNSPTQGVITLSPGDSARVVIACGDVAIKHNLEIWTDKLLYDTRSYWENWLKQCLYKGRWRRMVERSALTLKMLTYKPTGAILAAPTTSLPESIGGGRNWDYRFSWLRDSALIMGSLLPLGFLEESADYLHWIINKSRDDDDATPILYSITEKDNCEERILDQFEGYMGSAPVRIGNAAKEQVQLDVYGEIIDSIYIYNIFGHPPSNDIWLYVEDLANRICDQWNDKDEGIWEVRGDKKHFTYSKLMCWVGLDRAIIMAKEREESTDLMLWVEERKKIREFILTECVHKEKQYLTQSPCSDSSDASNLLAIILAFLPPNDPIMMNTVDQILEELTENNMVYRYLTDDGLEGEEGTFNICTFWLVEAMAIQGRMEQAEEIFNDMLNRSSNLGLYAEETDAKHNIALGNFPQAFSHLGLINSALILNHRNIFIDSK
ncbi:hypothetical protein A9Q99_00420 [Gammaproteobacteria bacterium 45_16_T64]|nr:hypothetical protein A9Q99_00420 [Gammaproteobacteria bacterium 45_16_T64]